MCTPPDAHKTVLRDICYPREFCLQRKCVPWRNQSKRIRTTGANLQKKNSAPTGHCATWSHVFNDELPKEFNTCSWFCVRKSPCYPIYIFAYILQESNANMCANILKTRFSKIGPEPDVLFNAFGHVHGFVFEKVSVIPYIRIYFAREHRGHVCEHLKNTFFKNRSGGRCPFQCFRTCSWFCVLKSPCYPIYIFAYILQESNANMCANI
jgi:hypothetical protein